MRYPGPGTSSVASLQYDVPWNLNVNMKHVTSFGLAAYFSLPSVKHKYILCTNLAADER